MPTCSICHKSVQQWQENEKGQKFCSDACAKTTWPKCSICSIAMNQWFTDEKGRKFCSDKCFNQALPTCSVCHKSMQQWQENEKGQKFCSDTCAKTTWSQCSICSIPMNQWITDDKGQKYCSDKCFSHTFPTCKSCGKRMKEWYTYDDGCKYCSDECLKQSKSKVALNTAQSTDVNFMENIANIFMDITASNDDHDQKLELMEKWNYIIDGYVSDKNLQKEFIIKDVSDVNRISDLKHKIEDISFIKKYSTHKEINRSMNVANKKLALINSALQEL
jgi:hypothetical protein